MPLTLDILGVLHVERAWYQTKVPNYELASILCETAKLPCIYSWEQQCRWAFSCYLLRRWHVMGNRFLYVLQLINRKLQVEGVLIIAINLWMVSWQEWLPIWYASYDWIHFSQCLRKMAYTFVKFWVFLLDTCEECLFCIFNIIGDFIQIFSRFITGHWFHQHLTWFA